MNAQEDVAGYAMESTPQKQGVDEKEWEKALSEISYEELRKKEKVSKKKKPQQDDTASFHPEIGQIIRIFTLILAVLVIGFLLFRLLSSDNLFSPKNRKIQNKDKIIDLDTIEQNLHESDLEKFIRQAIAQEAYDLAIRLYYLAVLKELSIAKKIHWKIDKTNGEYLREMFGKPEYNNFKEITRIFERVWYGTTKLNQADYDYLEPKFKSFIHPSTN